MRPGRSRSLTAGAREAKGNTTTKGSSCRSSLFTLGYTSRASSLASSIRRARTPIDQLSRARPPFSHFDRARWPVGSRMPLIIICSATRTLEQRASSFRSAPLRRRQRDDTAKRPMNLIREDALSGLLWPLARVRPGGPSPSRPDEDEQTITQIGRLRSSDILARLCRVLCPLGPRRAINQVARLCPFTASRVQVGWAP